MPAELVHLPVRLGLIPGEALDGYLERLAASNGYTRADLIALARAGDASSAFLTSKPDEQLLINLSAMTDAAEEELRNGTLAALPGIDLSDLNPRSKKTWRNVAARGWAPTHGTPICPPCLTEDGVWRIEWRHPWVTACRRHRVWLVSTCPTCEHSFRSHRTPLRPVDNDDAFCGNPHKVRGQGCRQRLAAVPTTSLPHDVIQSQGRVHAALHGEAVPVLGKAADADTYLPEIKALAVLLLHLGRQPGAERVAAWADLARTDHRRTAAGRGARWAAAPPTDARLRGMALATADQIVCQPTLDAAADALQPWVALTPTTNDGQLGWLADHTVMTPHLTRVVMAATAHRRRLSTLLRTTAPLLDVPLTALPQVLPTDLYDRYVAALLHVRPDTGRLFAALCLARRTAGCLTWAQAATLLDLPVAVGPATARACGGYITVPINDLVTRLNGLADALPAEANYPARRGAVRSLEADGCWYRTWSRAHRPGSPATSQRYAIAWLWTYFAAGRLEGSPAWEVGPPSTELRARYRRYVCAMSNEAASALIELATTTFHGSASSHER